MVAFDQLNGVRSDGCEVTNYSASKDLLQECASSAKETVISFRDTIMDSIPAEVFESFPSLKVLDASATHLSSIAKIRFDHLPDLAQLNLSNNSIVVIPDGIFERCNAIEINLQQNQIRELNSLSFTGLTKLTRLDLSYNYIARLEENVFRPLVTLKELRLDFNRIDVIDDTLFARNGQLQMLYLNNNLITFIANKAFGALQHLNALEIDNNFFPEINLMPMKRLRTVNVMNGNLTTLEIPNSVINVMAYDNQIKHINASIDSNLTTLMVGKNHLTSLDDLIEHRKLQDLELSYNNIERLDLTALTKMPQLRKLLIYGIKLDKLDADFMVNHLPNLHIIELSAGLYDNDELNAFASQLKGKIYVISDGGKVMNVNSKIIYASSPTVPANAINQLATENVTFAPVAVHSDTIATNGNIKLAPARDIQLIDRIQRLEQFIQSSDGRHTELQYKQSIDESIHTLRMMIVVTICAFSLFVAFQIFIFVRNNYTRLRIQTSTMLSNGRARSHEPMLEEVL